ncbi:unnamed protein product, partial [Rotaria sp. Silwood2]
NNNKDIILKNKRKRDISTQDRRNHHLLPSSSSSSSQYNIRPRAAKKLKKNSFIQSIPMNAVSENKKYPTPAYLVHSPHLIFRTLRQQLNCPLNKKDEQIFIHVRLQLFDRQYRLELDQRLWQSYLDLGLQEKSWPRSLYEIAKTDQANLCENYIMTQLALIDDQLEQCNMELSRQAQSLHTSILLPSLDIIDKELKNYVCIQQNYLVKRMDDRLIQCKNEIHDQQLYQEFLIHKNLMITIQREALENLIHLQHEGLQIYEEFILLEQRILHQFLPPNFDEFEKINRPNFYRLLIADHHLTNMDIKHQTIIKRRKRILITIMNDAYEHRIIDYEQQYHQGLNVFELRYANNIHVHGISFMDMFKTYMFHQKNRFIHNNIHHKITHARKIIMNHHQRSKLAKQMIGVSPEVCLNVLHCPYKSMELAHISLAESYVRPNQSILHPSTHIENEIQNTLKDMKEKVFRQITNYCKREPPKLMMNRFCELLENRLRQRFMAPIPYADQRRAQREYDLVKSIRRKAHKFKHIIRVCDKGGGLHIGDKSDYERKAAKYREDTKAYQELPSNPLKDMITNVINALDDMKKTKQISNYTYNRLVPNPKLVRLSYMYFNPKPHKVHNLIQYFH